LSERTSELHAAGKKGDQAGSYSEKVRVMKTTSLKQKKTNSRDVGKEHGQCLSPERRDEVNAPVLSLTECTLALKAKRGVTSGDP